jgi:hypothetical protein
MAAVWAAVVLSVGLGRDMGPSSFVFLEQNLPNPPLFLRDLRFALCFAGVFVRIWRRHARIGASKSHVFNWGCAESLAIAEPFV